MHFMLDNAIFYKHNTQTFWICLPQSGDSRWCIRYVYIDSIEKLQVWYIEYTYYMCAQHNVGVWEVILHSGIQIKHFLVYLSPQHWRWMYSRSVQEGPLKKEKCEVKNKLHKLMMKWVILLKWMKNVSIKNLESRWKNN